MFITDPKAKRQPVKRDPWAAEYAGGVQIVAPAQVPAGMVTGQPQAAPQPAQPGQQQPFYPAPVQAPQDPRAVTPHLASDLDRIRRYAALDYGPMGVPPEAFRNITSSEEAKVVADAYLEPLAPATSTPGSAAAAPAPAGAPIVESELLPKAPMPGQVVESKSLKPDAPLGETLHIPSRELKDAPRDQPAPAPAPTAPTASAAATPIIPLDAPSALTKRAEGDRHISPYFKLIEKRDKIVEDGGTPSPGLLSNIEKARKHAGIRYSNLKKEYEAQEQKAQDEDNVAVKKAADTAQAAKKKGDDAEAGKAADKASAQLLGRARAAVKDRPEAARKMAVKGMENARTPTESGYFQTVLDDIAAAEKADETKKAAAEKAAETKAVTAANKQAAREMQPKVGAAKIAYEDSKTALTAAIDAVKAIRDRGDLRAKDISELGPALNAEAAAKAARDAAYAEWRRLDNEMTDAAEGVQEDATQPEPTTQPAGATGQATGQAEPPTSQPVTPTGQATGQPAAIGPDQWEAMSDDEKNQHVLQLRRQGKI